MEIQDQTRMSSQRHTDYAVLSHTWRTNGDETTLQDMLPHTTPHTLSSKAFNKIRLTCEQAVRDGLEHVWIDTCCIDKTSSVELSEAINSMYAWYSMARVCYVYMEDVDIRDGEQAFRRSRWFTRAWTLQELLAPKRVRFYDKKWRFLGCLSNEKCASIVAEVTDIDISLLLRRSKLTDFSIAQRMSWAAHRHSTRLEDRAYSLLGIFDISMPMLYGEGHKAFVRLQEQIIKSSTDQSILCWDAPSGGPNEAEASTSRSLFAPSPSYFAGCGSIVNTPGRYPTPYHMTNRGMEITLPVREYVDGVKGRRSTYARLKCGEASTPASDILLSIEHQDDLDAHESDIFTPWIHDPLRRRQGDWDSEFGSRSGSDSVTPHARNIFAIGHSSRSSRIVKAAEDPEDYRQQTIVLLREFGGNRHAALHTSGILVFEMKAALILSIVLSVSALVILPHMVTLAATYTVTWLVVCFLFKELQPLVQPNLMGVSACWIVGWLALCFFWYT